MAVPRTLATFVLTGMLLLASAARASAEDAAEPGADNASCLGLGSSFYGQFAPQQRAFVAMFVNEQDGTPGDYYVGFAQATEGDGTYPPPCGTRIE
jgi:hypothetical protein